jgi:hypothetical protein
MATRMRVFLLFSIAMALPPRASAQQILVCYSVQQGDTTARVARRLTGDVRNVHEPWFQILDTSTRTFRAKNTYDLILPGWQVCFPKERLIGRLARASYLIPASTSAQAVRTDSPARWAFDVHPIWWIPASLVVAVLAAFLAKTDLDTQRTVRERMKALGGEFIREFERPLVRQPCRGHPIRARLQVIPRRGRLDILLAPNDRRTYPNLSDHRKNLEYDVERVLQVLGNELCPSGSPYARGAWVVIPFKLEASVKQRGTA